MAELVVTDASILWNGFPHFQTRHVQSSRVRPYLWGPVYEQRERQVSGAVRSFGRMLQM